MSKVKEVAKSRDEIDFKYKWDLDSMYKDLGEWEKDYKSSGDLAEEFAALSGEFCKSKEALLKAFTLRDLIWRKVEKVYVYARMKMDEDTRDPRFQALSDRSRTLIAKVAVASSFFVPELLEAGEDLLWSYFEKEAGLNVYKKSLQRILREKAHILSRQEENLLAKISELTPATNEIFSMINNADMKFDTITGEDGVKTELTHGTYINFLESRDRRVRKEAFDAMFKEYENRKNTLAATYNYNTKNDTIMAAIRKFPSAREAALFGDDIDTGVYDNLVATVNANLPLLHRYVALRKKALKLDEIRMYDMYVPLVESPLDEISYEDGLELVLEGLRPLGAQYIKDLTEGIKSRWIDVFESQGKTSGAYSFGSYDSYPYVLLNYSGKLKDVFTVAHELGHSMHSYYTRKNQPYVYGSHSIFTAEVASTVNENLLMQYLLGREKDPIRRQYLLNLNIDGFRGTVYRQTMFAEFEKLAHEAVEAGEVLTAEWLSDKYFELNRKYFGGDVSYDPEIAMEWARIPHFYNAFYVYKYATGYSAAIALTERLLNEGESARDDYLNFLKAGESDDPIPLLKKAGVDMGRAEPIEAAMKSFAHLIDELEEFHGKQ